MDTSLFSVCDDHDVWPLSLYKLADYTPGGIVSVSCSQVTSETLIQRTVFLGLFSQSGCFADIIELV